MKRKRWDKGERQLNVFVHKYRRMERRDLPGMNLGAIYNSLAKFLHVPMSNWLGVGQFSCKNLHTHNIFITIIVTTLLRTVILRNLETLVANRYATTVYWACVNIIAHVQ